jgi:CheY-like chemotaxis protein
MPEMDGWTLAERLRELGHGAPIIVISAHIGDIQTPRLEGLHNDTLAKPFDIRRLADVLGRHMGIDWIYRSDGGAGLAGDGDAKKEWIAPEVAEIGDLIRLAEIGYVRGIQARLATIAERQGDGGFAEKAGAFVQNFDMEGLLSFLNALVADQTEGTSR